MPVVASAGLVGHVVRVTPDSSIVQLIIDPDSFVAGRLDVSGETGLLEGEGDERPPDEPGRARTIEVPPDETRRDRRLPDSGGVAGACTRRTCSIGTCLAVLADDRRSEKFVTVRRRSTSRRSALVLVVLSGGPG